MPQRFGLWLRVIFPVLMLVGLDVWPGSRLAVSSLIAARTAERAGRPVDAAHSLQRLMEIEPYRKLDEQIGIAFVQAGEYQSGAAFLERAESGPGLSYAGLMAWAEAWERLGDPARAAGLWRAAADHFPGSEGLRRLVFLLRANGAYHQALETAQEWVQRSPEDAQAAAWVGLLLAADQPDKALDFFQRASVLDPAVYGEQWSSFRLAAGRASLSPDPAYRLVVIGRWLGTQGAWDLSEDALRQAVDLSPGFAEAWALLGQARIERGEEGIDLLKKAVDLNQQSVLSRGLLAYYLARNHNNLEAIEQVRVLIELEPGQSAWQLELGNLLAAQGDLTEARRVFEKVQTLNPDDPEVLAGVARFSYQYQVDLREVGLPAARRYIFFQPERVDGYDLAGAILLSLGDLRGAERFLQRGLQLNANYAQAHLHLGQVYLHINDPERARYHLKRALQLDKNGEIGNLAGRLIEKYLGEDLSS